MIAVSVLDCSPEREALCAPAEACQEAIRRSCRVLEPVGDLGARGRLTGALQATSEWGGRRRRDIDVLSVGPSTPLARRARSSRPFWQGCVGFHHVLPRLFLHLLGEVATTSSARPPRARRGAPRHGLADVAVGQRAALGQLVENAGRRSESSGTLQPVRWRGALLTPGTFMVW